MDATGIFNDREDGAGFIRIKGMSFGKAKGSRSLDCIRGIVRFIRSTRIVTEEVHSLSALQIYDTQDITLLELRKMLFFSKI